MRYGKITLFAALALALASQLASADPYPQKRDGFYMGCGLGGGTGAVSISGNGLTATSDRQGGAVGSLRFGWSVAPKFSVGMESNAWTRTIDGDRVSFSVATLAGTFYPNPDQGFYMRAGVGGGNQKWTSSAGSTTVSASKNGFGFTTGMGYEMRLTPHWSIGPALDFGYISVDQQGTTIAGNYVNFTAQMNWFFF